MIYLQSNDESSEELAGVVDGVFTFVSENDSPSSEKSNGRRLATAYDSLATTTIATRITPETVSALFGYFESRNFFYEPDTSSEKTTLSPKIRNYHS